MQCFLDYIPLSTSGDTDIIDITQDVGAILYKSGIKEGLITIFISGSTASITSIEYESGAVQDLKKAIDRIAPKDMHYAHNARWHDGNGFSHVRAALLGSSFNVPIQNGKLLLGTWQQIIFCDFDNRPRQRKITVQIIGE